LGSIKSFRFLSVFLGLGLLILVLTGCGGTAPMTRSEFVEFTPEQQQEIQAGEAKEYMIQEGDILKVAFSYQPELNQNGVVVLTDGSINLIGIDRVEVAGMTMTEADRVITDAYSQEYRDPTLSLIIQETQGRKVYVMGEVKTPGLHPVPMGGLDMMSAIARAGGFNENAAREGVILIRVTQEGYSLQEINMRDLHSIEASQYATLRLEPLDVIYVPRSRVGDFYYFSRTVLAGIVSVTRIATDLKYLSGGGIGRF